MSEHRESTIASRERIGDAEIVHVRGEIDMATIAPVRQEVDAAWSALDGAGVLVVDLTSVTFFSSAGLNLLAETHDRCSAEKVSLRVVVNNAMVSRPLAITGMDQVLATYPTIPEAVDSAH